MSLISKDLTSTEKSCTYSFNPIFSCYQLKKSLEMLLKPNGYGFISESLAKILYFYCNAELIKISFLS